MRSTTASNGLLSNFDYHQQSITLAIIRTDLHRLFSKQNANGLNPLKAKHLKRKSFLQSESRASGPRRSKRAARNKA